MERACVLLMILKNKSTGEAERLVFELELRKPDNNGFGWGDGTVPTKSAKGSLSSVFSIPFRAGVKSNLKSFDHQLSYNHSEVQLATLWSLVHFVKKMEG